MESGGCFSRDLRGRSEPGGGRIRTAGTGLWDVYFRDRRGVPVVHLRGSKTTMVVGYFTGAVRRNRDGVVVADGFRRTGSAALASVP